MDGKLMRPLLFVLLDRPDETVGRPTRGPSARAFWRAAKDAVINVAKKGHVTVSSLSKLLTDAATYKIRYSAFLRDCVVAHHGHIPREKTNLLFSAAEAKRARARADQGMLAQLHYFEDILPADTLAWCRMVAGTALTSGGGGIRAKSLATSAGKRSVPSRTFAHC